MRSDIARWVTYCCLMATALAAAGTPSSALTSGAEYVECVTSALTAMEAGANDAALAQLKAALKWDANDPLAHTALGVCLLMGRRTGDASAEFSVSATLDPKRSEALYGQALVRLAEGRTAAATELFCKAQSVGARPEIEEAIWYVKSLSGASDQPSGTPESELGRAIAALRAMGRGQYAESAAVWNQLQATQSAGPEEKPGCYATFAASKPMSIAGNAIKGRVDLPAASRFKGPKLSGSVSLRADLTKVKDVKMVAFLVDNRLAGLTNEPPFQYMWDTTRVTNGQHTVRIVGSDSYGCTVSEKTTVVHVRNMISANAAAAGAGSPALWSRLWALMRLRPSAASVNYNLAMCLLNTGGYEAARAALERVMAADPTYEDAAHMLAQMCTRPVRGEILHRVATDAKVVALTFDDGPSADSGRLLDLLKHNDVKATFFVVGKQVMSGADTLRRMAQEGHQIENHTYGHRALDFLSSNEIAQEFFRCSSAVRSVTGKGTSFLRPPGGRSGKRLEEVAKRFGVTTVFWTANCTSREGTSWEKMRDYIVASASPGAIFLMHNAEGVTLRALPAAIKTLRERGYRFTTLSELVNESTRQVN